MAAVQQFRLRWNNHQPNFITMFTKLLNSEELVDVTLGAEGQNLQAHKVVLSACSTYFQTLFKINPCKHPIVILKDVKFEDLKVIVDFMYYGEVNVSQEQLPAILKTAEVLKVKGLAEMPEQNNISLSKSRSLSSDKGDEASVVNAECSSAWGSDSVRQSPSPHPMSPSVRRKRLRKTSTGSGSGSTERMSERTSEELSLDVNMVKTEPSSFQSEGESIRSNSSLRNSLQEVSTESEPPDGLHESNEDHTSMHSSQESVTGPPMDANPGPSTAFNPAQGQSWMSMDPQTGYQEVYATETNNDWKQFYQPEVYSTGRSDYEFINMTASFAKPGDILPVKRKRTALPQNHANFKLALDAVMIEGMSYCKAAQKYGVNNRTLWLECRKRGYTNMRTKSPFPKSGGFKPAPTS